MSMSTGGAERDDYDARFADIVARWDDLPLEALEPSDTRDSADSSDNRGSSGTRDSEVRRHDAAGPRDLDDSDVLPRPQSPASPIDPHPQPAEPRVFEEPTPFRLHEAPEEDDGFEPPPPRPLPSFYDDWPFYLALVGLVGGPLWLVFLVVFASTEHSQMLVAGALTVVGFVTLVLRQPRERDLDGDDDGARV